MSFREAEEALHREAREACGFDDFGDDEYLPGLRTLLESLDTEARLTSVGRMVVRSMIVEALVARLHTAHGRARFPECRDAPVAGPLVIVGLPRTGTTALQHLLAQSPDLQGLELWLASTPKPRPPREAWARDAGFRACDERMRFVAERSPDLQAIHPMAADLPDECWRLLSQSFAHSSWQANTNVPGYARWWASCDMRPAYRQHRRNLELIGHREPERRWLLKDATHLFALDAFLDVYPDAMIVQTHRDPLKLVPSVCSLCWAARRPLNESEDRARFGRATLELWERAILAAHRVRQGRSPEQFYDLPFERFASDPLGAVRDIHAYFDLPYDDEAEAAIRGFRERNPPGKHGEHAYALEDWGLDAGEIRERFRPYVEAYDVMVG